MWARGLPGEVAAAQAALRDLARPSRRCSCPQVFPHVLHVREPGLRPADPVAHAQLAPALQVLPLVSGHGEPGPLPSLGHAVRLGGQLPPGSLAVLRGASPVSEPGLLWAPRGRFSPWDGPGAGAGHGILAVLRMKPKQGFLLGSKAAAQVPVWGSGR